MKKNLFLTLTFCIQLLYIQAQTSTLKEFSTKSDEDFLKDYVTFCSSYTSNVACKTEAAQLAAVFTEFSSADKSAFINLANNLLKVKGKPFPQFLQLNKTINKVAVSDDKRHLLQHIEALNWVTTNSTGNILKKVEDYCTFTENLSVGGNLFASPTRNAKLVSMDYTYNTESDGPVIKFSNNRLINHTKGDTIDYKNITGTFYPFTNMLHVVSAETDFIKLGYKPSDVSLKLFQFKWDLNKVDVEVDSAIITFNPYLDRPVKGKYIDKILTVRPKTNISYPQFISNQLQSFTKFSPEVSFEGSLQILGDRLYVGPANNQLTASVKVKSPNAAYFRAVAPRFLIKDFNEIMSDQAAVAIYIDNDSITHPMTNFTYNISKREINVTKLDKGSGKAPFASTYHQMNIYSDRVVWKIDSTNLFLKPITNITQKPTVIESFDYYQKGAELKYQNPGGSNPLFILDQFSKSYGVPNLVIPARDLAGSLGGANLSVKSIENMLYRLTEDGFIIYNSLDETIRILDKTSLYVEASKRERDFDNMRFLSKNSIDNGKLSISQKSIDFKGIEEFSISESKGVYAFPKKSNLKVSEDRSMKFDGDVQAGKVLFIGEDINFDYKDFKIVFNKLDSMIIFVPSNKPDSKGTTPDIALKTVISDITGELFIDEPGNRSSRNNYEEFPYFVANDTAFVYYEKSSYQNRKYTKDKLKFAIDPFRFDNLDEFKYKEINFPGTLRAPEIIEPIRASLIVMSDLSLGFEKEIAKPGARMYNENAFFSQKLKLDNNGLIGDGVLNFEDAEMKSPAFNFFPDSVFAVLTDFKTNKNLKSNSPQSAIDSAYLHWFPSKDSLVVSRLNNHFSMYDNQVNYKGDLYFLKNNTINGIGTLEWNGGKMVSNFLNFKANEVIGNDAKLEIKTSDTSVNAIVTLKGEVTLDLDNQTCTVILKGDSLMTELPFTLLQTSAEKYVWDMKQGKVNFIRQPGKNQFFYSLNPKFDSLKFDATEAIYSLKDNNLFATGVSGLYVADSKVIPSEGKLMIQAGGDISTLQNSTVILNAEKEYHKIENATTDIQSSKLFRSVGSLSYKNSFGNVSSIKVEDIGVKVDTIVDVKTKKGVQKAINYSTYAVGKIYEEEGFKLEDIVFYKGDVFLSSLSDEINFDGYAKLDIQSSEFVDWFKLNQKIDPKNFEIKLNNLESDRKQPVISGLLVNPNFQNLYPAIMRTKETPQDVLIYQATGVMKPGTVKNTYIFGEEGTLKGENPYGSKMTYNDELQTIEATGRFDLTGGLRMVKVEAFGDMNYETKYNKTTIQATLGVDFMMDPVLWTKLANDIDANNETTLSVTYKKNKTIKQAMYNWITDKNIINDMITVMDQDNYLKLPPTFPFKLLLTDVVLQWDGTDGTFKGSDKFGLVSLNNKMIEEKIKCDIEVGYQRGSSEMKILLTTTSGTWYFIHLRNGYVGILSSDELMNESIRKSTKNTITTKTEGTIYECTVANRTAKANFDYAIEDFKERLKLQNEEKK